MKLVKASSLDNLKSVFDNADTNVFHFENLNSTFNNNAFNVRLAEPSIRKRDNSLLWQSNFVQEELLNFDDLNDSERLSVLSRLEQSIEWAKRSAKGIAKDFYDQVIEIPSTNSIFLSKGKDGEVVIVTEWGFLENRTDVNKGILKKLFPAPQVTILVVLEDDLGNRLSNVEICLSNNQQEFLGVTDDQGKARFGMVRQSSKFSVTSSSNLFEQVDFVADGRDVYLIKVRIPVELTFLVQNATDEFLEKSLTYISGEDVREELFFYENKLKIKTSYKPAGFVLRSGSNKLVQDSIPKKDGTYVINLPEQEKVIPEPPKELPIIEVDEPNPILDTEKPENVKEIDNNDYRIKIVNAFNRPIKGKKITITSDNHGSFNYVTNKQGVITPNYLDSTSQLSIRRYSSIWRFNIDFKRDNYFYHFKLKPIFPWMWWLATFIALWLLICCMFFSCFCDKHASNYTSNNSSHYSGGTRNNTKNNSNGFQSGNSWGDNEGSYLQDEDKHKEIPQIEEDKGVVNCDQITKAGGAGVTSARHPLGKKNGQVTIQYNMEEIPDKLEVFYEGKLVTSTEYVEGNESGFVGGQNRAGCCATLMFNYVYNRDDFCIVKVSGPNNTEWAYQMGCPQ